MFKKILLGALLLLVGAGLGLCILFLIGQSPIRRPQIIGFVPYWLLDKADRNYRPFFTTLTYFGLAVDVDGKPIYLVNPQEEEPGWTALKNDRFDAQDLSASLLVHSADEDKIALLIQKPEAAAHALVTEVAPIMKKYGFSDLNLDIESFLEASDSARANYTLFAKTVAEDVRAANLGTITIEIPPIALVRKFLIDPIAIGKIADFVVMMTYDYHYSGSFLAGPVAPAGGVPNAREFDVETAIQEAVKVIPKEKLILGIPLYGYQWETISDRPGAATIPGGASTASTRRIAELLSECATCSAQYDPVAKEPYLIFPEGDYFKQTFYENEQSLQEKITLAKKYQLEGVALWALGYENESILAPLSAYKQSFEFRR